MGNIDTHSGFGLGRPDTGGGITVSLHLGAAVRGPGLRPHPAPPRCPLDGVRQRSRTNKCTPLDDYPREDYILADMKRKTLRDEIQQTKDFPSLGAEVYLNLLRTAEALSVGPQGLLRDAGVSHSQYNVLRILRGAGDSRLSCREIVDRMVTRDPDMTRLLDGLEAKGAGRAHAVGPRSTRDRLPDLGVRSRTPDRAGHAFAGRSHRSVQAPLRAQAEATDALAGGSTSEPGSLIGNSNSSRPSIHKRTR